MSEDKPETDQESTYQNSSSDNDNRKERRIRDFARRIFRDDAETDDGTRSNRELLGSILETGDKAKTEIVRMIGREVRGYLEALDLHNDLHHLLTNYSLEVKASFSLKPLAESMPASPQEEDDGVDEVSETCDDDE